MDLILWRHAEAVEREGLPDLERMLTSKGERQAARMADWLNQRIAHSTRVLVSPALRCQQTAKALGRKFRTVEAIAPDAGPASGASASSVRNLRPSALAVCWQRSAGLTSTRVECAMRWFSHSAMRAA